MMSKWFNGNIHLNKLIVYYLLMLKRVQFSKGMQKRLIKNLKEKTGLSWEELAKKLNINVHSLSKSYLFELCDLPYSLFKKIISILKKSEEETLKEYNAIIKEQELTIGRKVLGEQKKKQSKIKIQFKNKSLHLDCSKVKYSKYDLQKKIKLPDKITPKLAEEIGMHFGDGFLSSHKYEYRLKGNPADEQEYYDSYIKPLFKELYNIEIFPKEYTQSFGFEIKSKALWEFKSNVLGIKTGDKNEIFLPEILKVNNREVICSFLRGLFDTDGCLYFRSSYGYEKYYPTIALNLASKNLIKDVGEIMYMLGFNPNIYFYRDYATIRLNGIASLKRYEQLIGWSSQKNLKRLNDWKNKYKQLYNMAAVV